MKKICLFVLLIFIISSTHLFAARVIVFDDEYNKAIASSSIKKSDYKIVRKSKGGFKVLEIDETKLKKSNIKYILDKKIFRKASLPNDPGISSQWSIFNTKLSDLWNSKGYNCSSVTVAIVDTGVDYSHEDLAGNIKINSNEIPGNNIDDDSNGFKDDYYGYDFAYDDSDPNDGDGHGTHVAGIVGAVINNGKGIAGVCDVKILPVKVLDDRGDGYISDVVEGIYYAVNMGAKVVNLSMEANTSDSSYINLFTNAITYARNKGVMVVTAAGNSGKDLSSSTVLPASLRNNNLNMIVAGSYSSANSISYFSNVGGLVVDIFAPGEDIYSTFKNNTYYTDTGTSMSVPFITGLVAFLYSQEPNLSFQDVRNRLYNSTIKNSNFTGYSYCDGKIDASKLFNTIQRPIITKISNIRPAIQEQVTLEGAFSEVSTLFFNGRSIPFNKISSSGISFKFPFLEINEDYGLIKAVNSYGESNAIKVYPDGDVFIDDNTQVQITSYDANIKILDVNSYYVPGYLVTGMGVKFYLQSSKVYTTLTVKSTLVSVSSVSSKYGILTDENNNVVAETTSTTGEYTFDNVSSNKVYIFVEANGIAASGGGGCFIATAAYGSYFEPHVKVLRDFRDRYLMTNATGKWFVEAYYKYSPPIADYIRDKELLKFIVRMILTPIVFMIEHFYLSLLYIMIGSFSIFFYRRYRFKVNVDK